MNDIDYLAIKNREMPKFLELPRRVTYDYHIYQATNWLKFDAERKLDNTLVYTCLELRFAIERYIFELLYLLNDYEPFSKKEEGTLNTFGGIWKLIHKKEPLYRKRVEFTKLVIRVNPNIPPINIMNIEKLELYWKKLSGYLHKQLDPKTTWESPNRTFQKKAYELIDEIVNMMTESASKGHLGLMKKASMPDEARDVYEQFMSDKITADQTYRMLNLMKPVLDQRRFLKELQ